MTRCVSVLMSGFRKLYQQSLEACSIPGLLLATNFYLHMFEVASGRCFTCFLQSGGRVVGVSFGVEHINRSHSNMILVTIPSHPPGSCLINNEAVVAGWQYFTLGIVPLRPDSGETERILSFLLTSSLFLEV